MIRPQNPSVRSVYDPSSTHESSTSIGDITSYLGKILSINHYQVLVESILGQGGFAFVFLVRSFNQQRYALKRMYVNNQRDLLVCQREIALLREFSSHPNIVKYVDASIRRSSPTHAVKRQLYIGQNDQDDDDDAIHEILLLTEYCTNGALISRLNEQRSLGITLNDQQILRIFADICRAVSACHFRRPQPILHRDIKLENIIIDSRQFYVLCDFGSAILLSSSTTTKGDYQQYSSEQLTTNLIQQLEEEIQRYTTLSYRAPEMIDLYSRAPITLKADIWAMGCLLYKLMYNTMPFGESILGIQNGTFVIPDDMSHVYSRELNLFLRYMLEIDAAKRPDIWQVSYVTFKLLGLESPIPNRCQSSIPDLTSVSMPLTDKESRQQRTLAASKGKSTSSNVINESLPLGTAVNPRERPRGMIPPSVSLMNFSPTTIVRSTAAVVQSPPSRSDSAAQLMFEDDFSRFPSHGISLTNISKTTTAVSRARPSPPATISTASGVILQQQLIPPPPASSSTLPAHRRSSSQTVSSTNNQPPFPNASSVDSQVKLDDDDEQSQPVTTTEYKAIKQNSSIQTDHHPATEEAENVNNQHSLSKNERTFNKQRRNVSDISNEQLDHRQTLNRLTDDSSNEDQRINVPTTSTVTTHPSNKHHHSTDSAFTDCGNPFLHAPFHHLPTHKQRTTAPTIPIPMQTPATYRSSFNMNDVICGTKSSAFAPYRKQQSTLDDSFLSGSLNDQPASSNNVFTNAPFKSKALSKPCSMPTNQIHTTNVPSSVSIDFNHQDHDSSNSSSTLSTYRAVGSSGLVHNFDPLPRTNTTYVMSSHEQTANRRNPGLDSKQQACANTSFADTFRDEYF